MPLVRAYSFAQRLRPSDGHAADVDDRVYQSHGQDGELAERTERDLVNHVQIIIAHGVLSGGSDMEIIQQNRKYFKRAIIDRSYER